MIKRKHPTCIFCKSDETIPLTNYGKQINNHFQCLDCKKQFCVTCNKRRIDCKCVKVIRKNPKLNEKILRELEIIEMLLE